MSQCIVPSWNVEQVEADEGSKRQNPITTPQQQHHHHHHSTHLVPMSNNYEVAELTWENGQVSMHELSGLLHSGPAKPTWGRASDTLESIVHQATCHKQNVTNLQPQQPAHHHQQTLAGGNITVPTSSSSERKWTAGDHHHHHQQLIMKKRARSSDQYSRNVDVNDQRAVDRSACGSASATFCRDNNGSNNNNNNNIETASMTRTWGASMDSLAGGRSLRNKATGDEDSTNLICRDTNDTTMMTWPSYESLSSFKTKTTDEDSENQDEDGETKTETLRSHSSSRRSRAAAVHNQSERRRRDRINQKMKALQRLVPNANKTDKASMLDEVIEYLKQLQSQVQMMINMRNVNMAQMMMPIQQQQQLQMSILSRMGLGVGPGMGMSMLPAQLIHPAAAATPFAAAAPFVLPPIIPTTTTHATAAAQNPKTTATNGSAPSPDPYSAFLAQSMNMELYNKMAALYRQQQVTQSTQGSGCSSQSNHRL